MEQKRVKAIEELSYRIAMPIIRRPSDSFPVCPRCERELEMEHQRFCGYCGQKLEWEDELQ